MARSNEKECAMKLLRLFILGLGICVAQTACSGVKMSYSETTPIANDVQIPSLLLHGDKYAFVVATEPNVTCYAAISFWNKNDNWTFDELPSKKADDTGICKWEWEIPSYAKDGVGEFRGYVENDKQSTGFFPTNFCIERCP